VDNVRTIETIQEQIFQMKEDLDYILRQTYQLLNDLKTNK